MTSVPPERDAWAELRRATSEEWARFEGQALGRVLDEDPPTEPELLVNLEDEPSAPTLLVLPDPPPAWALAALFHESLGLGPYDSPSTEPLAGEPFETTVIDEQLLRTLLQKGASR